MSHNSDCLLGNYTSTSLSQHFCTDFAFVSSKLFFVLVQKSTLQCLYLLYHFELHNFLRDSQFTDDLLVEMLRTTKHPHCVGNETLTDFSFNRCEDQSTKKKESFSKFFVVLNSLYYCSVNLIKGCFQSEPTANFKISTHVFCFPIRCISQTCLSFCHSFHFHKQS